jgi:hypothetical protein
VTAGRLGTPDRLRTAGGAAASVSVFVFLFVAILVAAFVGTRVALFFDVAPILDADTFKYLGAADSLWNGNGWPPVFVRMHEGGGALHAVPGYTWFLLAIWTLAGTPVLSAVAAAQAALSLASLAAMLDLTRHWVGRGAMIPVAALVAASPSLAFLDHMMMPEAAG